MSMRPPRPQTDSFLPPVDTANDENVDTNNAAGPVGKLRERSGRGPHKKAGSRKRIETDRDDIVVDDEEDDDDDEEAWEAIRTEEEEEQEDRDLSWTTMSEIDSQYSSSVRLGLSVLLTDTDGSDHDHDGDVDDDDDDADPMVPPPPPTAFHRHSLPPLGMVSTPRFMNTSSFHRQQHQQQPQRPQRHSIATSGIIGSTRMIGTTTSIATTSTDHSTPSAKQPAGTTTPEEGVLSPPLILGQQRVEEAEARVLQAREALARVTKNFEQLQERHGQKVRELQEQLDAATMAKTQTTAKDDDESEATGKNDNMVNVDTPVDVEYREQLEIARWEKLAAESKLADAIQKLQLVESEKQQMHDEKRNLQTKLEATLKQVRFSEDQNSILEFRVGEYKTKWENSVKHTKQIESKLITTRSVLENATKQVEQTKEYCEKAIANASRKAAKEQSLREEHAQKERHIAERLETQFQQNERLLNEQLGLVNAVQSLQKERSGLRDELARTNSRRNDVEQNLTRANQKCQKLHWELENVKGFVDRLDSNHKRKQKELQESLESRLEELETSVSVLAAKDEMNAKKLSEQSAETSRLRRDARDAETKAQEHFREEQRLLSEHFREEQRLLSELKETNAQKESAESKLEELRKTIETLAARDQRNKQALSEYKVELSKVTGEFEKAQSKLKAEHDERLHDLRDVRGKAEKEKESSEAKIEELRRAIDVLVAKDESNESLLLEHEAEMAKLKADAEAAKLEAELKHEEEQRRFVSELNASRDKAQEQKESSDSELDVFRKSIDDLIAKDENELDMLRKSIDALAFKDELNQKMLSGHEAEELRLKADSEAALREAQATFEAERRRLSLVEQKLLSDLNNYYARTTSLQNEKNSLEETVSALEQEHTRLTEEVAEVSGRWKAAETKANELAEEKRLLNADLTASRYSILRLESEWSRAITEREELAKLHELELTKQKSIASSSQAAERSLKIELDAVRNNQKRLEDDKAELESQLNAAEGVHGHMVEVHEDATRKFHTKIRKLQLEHDSLEKRFLDFESKKLDLECQLGKLREEHESLQKTQDETKLELCRRSKEQEESSKASFDRYELLEREHNQLLDKVETMHAKKIGLEEKLQSLVENLQISNAKLTEKEKIQCEMEDFLFKERSTIVDLENEKDELMKQTTSMSVQHANSILEYKRKTAAAQAKVLQIKSECVYIQSGISLTTAAKATLEQKLENVKEEFTQLQEAHRNSQEKIAEMISVHNKSRMSFERQVSELVDRQKRLETEKENSNRVQVEFEEKLNDTVASLEESQRCLFEKGIEVRNLELKLTKTLTNVRKLEEQNALLVAEKEARASEVDSMIALQSVRMKDHESEVLSLKEKLEITTGEKKKLQKRVAEFDITVSALQHKCDDTTSQLSETSRRLEASEEEKLSLESRLQSSETEIDGLYSKCERAQYSIEALHTRITTLEAEVFDQTEREEYLVSNLQSIKEENESRKKSAEALIREQELTKMESECENDRLVSEIRSLEKQHKSFTQQREIADSISFFLNRKFNVCEAQNSKLVTERGIAMQRLESLESNQDVLLKQIEIVKAAKAASENAAQSNIQELVDDKDHLNLNMSNAKGTIANLHSEADKASKKITSLTADLEKANHSIASLRMEKSCVMANLVEAEETIATLRIQAEGTSKENASLSVNLEEANCSIATLQTEVNEAAIENVGVNCNLEEAKQVILTMQAQANEVSVDSFRLIASLEDELKDAKQTIVLQKSEAVKVAEENSCLIANLEGQLQGTKATVALQQSEAKKTAEENACLIANLEGQLQGTKGTITKLQTEADRAAEENSCLIDKLKDELNAAKNTILALESKAGVASTENTRLVADLKDALKLAKDSISILHAEADEAAKVNSCLIANLKGDLEKAKGTIAMMQQVEKEADDKAKEKTCLIANLKDDLKDAKGTIVALQSDLDRTLAQHRDHVSALDDLRGVIATKKEKIRDIESKRNLLLDEIENANKNSTHFRNVGEEKIRSLQNDLSKERRTTETLRNEKQILLRKAHDHLTKERKEAKTRDESARLEHERESRVLRQQLEEAFSNGTLLRQVIVSLESEMEAELSRYSKQEHLRSMDGATIQRLEDELEKAVREKDEQIKTTKKLGKLLKRTMLSVTRVSRMKMKVDLRYFNSVMNEYRQLPSKAEYSGPVVDSKPHGEGVMTFENGDMYLGSFEDGELKGEGSYIAATHNIKLFPKLQFDGLYDYNEVQRQRIQIH